LGSNDLVDLKVEFMQLKSGQTKVENVTAVQMTLVQEDDPPLVAHHVMAASSISAEAIQITDRAEDLVLITEAHLARGNNLKDFEDKDVEPEDEENGLNITFHPSRDSSVDRVKTAVSYRQKVIENCRRDKEVSEERDLSKMPGDKSVTEEVFLKKVEEIKNRKSLEDQYRAPPEVPPEKIGTEEDDRSRDEIPGHLVGVGRERSRSEHLDPQHPKKSSSRAASVRDGRPELEGHLRSKIRKAGERQMDLKSELVSLEKRVQVNKKSGINREGVLDVDEEIKCLKTELKELSDLEHQVVELSVAMWGKEFSERRAKDWWGWRGEAIQRIQKAKDDN
jgi:hypothetical protein